MRRPSFRMLLLGSALAGVGAGAARADTPTGVRVRMGEHEGYSRVVFDLPQPDAAFHVTRQGNQVTVRFDGAGQVPDAGGLRNVLGVRGGTSYASLTVPAGAEIRSLQLDRRVVIDVMAPGGEPAPAPAAAAKIMAPLRREMAEAVTRPAPKPAAPRAAPARAAEPRKSEARRAEARRPEPQKPEPRRAETHPAPSPSPTHAPAHAPVPAVPANAPALPRPTPPAPEEASGEPPTRGRATRQTGRSQREAPAEPHLPAVPPTAHAPAATAPAAPAPSPAPVAPVDAATLPAPGAAAHAPPPAEAPTPPVAAMPPPDPNLHAMTLPFAAGTGAAAFRRGATAVLVFDERRAIDLSAMQGDPVFGGASVQLLDGATVLRMPLPRSESLRLIRAAAGWTVTATPGEPPAPIAPAPARGEVLLAAGTPGRVVAVPDMETGWNLLVGTQRASGQAVAVRRQTPGFVILPSWQGVVIEPRSDSLSLRSSAAGFILGAPGQDIATAAVQPPAQVQANASALTRRYNLPNLPVPALEQRMEVAALRAAGTPPLSRFAPRRALGEALIALGMGAEAQSVLQLAGSEDPQHADDAEFQALAAIAAVLADRPAEAGALDDQRLSGIDEITLWRAVRAARLQEGAPAAAAPFAATLPLLLSYPPPLRDRLLPPAAETMAMAGQPDAAARLIAAATPPAPPPKPAASAAKPAEGHAAPAAHGEAKPAASEHSEHSEAAHGAGAAKPPPPPEPPKPPATLDYARGLLAQARGNTDDALAIFDAVAQGRDQYRAARAFTRAVELRLASGKMDAGAAADALSRRLLAWRGDGTELAQRLRIAQLDTQARRWRAAIDLLRDTASLYPDQRELVRQRQADAFTAMLQDADPAKAGSPSVSSLDLVSLTEENPDLIPAGPAGEKLAALLADRLVALDLPKRAIPALDKLMQAAPVGDARAAIGARLARLRMDEGDPAAALATLDASGDGDVGAPLQEQRLLARARAMARQGDTQGAVALLGAAPSAAAQDLRAALLAGAKDWKGAEAALSELVASSLPPDGALNDRQQDLLIRLASAAAQANDEPALRELAQRYAARMANPKLAQMFRLLTGAPVTGMADVPRVTQDIALMRGLPANLGAIGGSVVTR